MKHVEQFIERNRPKKLCILLVVLRYTCDARKYKHQIMLGSSSCEASLYDNVCERFGSLVQVLCVY